MDNKIVLDLTLFKMILEQEAKKLTGRTMKRFELSTDLETVKKEVKELQYEFFRDLYDMLQNGKIIFQINQSKEN